jgi:psp operon transcriptional activator
LCSYSWPGNIRELKNVIERAVYQNTGGSINKLVFNPFDSPYRLSNRMPSSRVESPASASVEQSSKVSVQLARDIDEGTTIDFKTEVQDFEIGLLKQAMEQCQFNQKKAAETLGLSYHQLRGYLRKYELLS